MIISVTERGGFRRCRRRWDYSSLSRQGLEPVMNAPALTVGTLVHSTLEEWMHAEKKGENIDLFEAYRHFAADKIREIKENYKARIGVYPNDDEFYKVLEEIEIGESMVRNYQTYWKQPLPDEYEVLAPEQQFVVDIPNTWHWECEDGEHMLTYDFRPNEKCPDGKEYTYQLVQLEATFDALIRRKRDGWVFILERKTYKNRPKLESLKKNDQFLTYTWVLQQVNIGKVGGVLYDGLWKRDGKSKRHTIDMLFLRDTVERSQEEIDEIGRILADEAMDMINPRIYPNRRWEGCYDCRFERLCNAESRGEDFEYVRDTYYQSRKRGADARGSVTEDDEDLGEAES